MQYHSQAANQKQAHLGNIPQELKAEDRWVVWKWEKRGDKRTKPPRIARRPKDYAKSNDPATWSSYCHAVDALGRLPWLRGLGFMLGDSWVGVDLDKCRNPQTGDISEDAQRIIRRLDSYAEISPSLTGIKIFVRCQVVLPGRRDGGCQPVEIYAQRRFFCTTGWHLSGTPSAVLERSQDVLGLYNELFPVAPTLPRTEGIERDLPISPTSEPGDLEEYLERCAMAEVGERSEADFSLCCAAIKAGVTAEEIYKKCHHLGKFAERGRRYFDRTWESAITTVANEQAEVCRLRLLYPFF